MEILLSDTVGFIRKLPHHLVEAFKATLEELTFADLLIHVIDASNPEWETQAEVVNSLITQLGADQTPRLEVFNKSDLYTGERMPIGENIVAISALTGEGTDALVAKIEQLLDKGKKKVVLHLPYSKGGVLDLLHKEAEILRTDYLEDCIEVETIVRADTYGKVRDYVMKL